MSDSSGFFIFKRCIFGLCLFAFICRKDADGSRDEHTASFDVVINAEAGTQIIDLNSFSQVGESSTNYEVTQLIKKDSVYTYQDKTQYICDLKTCQSHFSSYFCLTNRGIYKTTACFKGIPGDSYFVNFKVTTMTSSSNIAMKIRVISPCEYLKQTYTKFEKFCSPSKYLLKPRKTLRFSTELTFNITNQNMKIYSICIYKNFLIDQISERVTLNILSPRVDDQQLFIVRDQEILLQAKKTEVKLQLVTEKMFASVVLTLVNNFQYIKMNSSAVKLFLYQPSELCSNQTCTSQFNLWNTKAKDNNCTYVVPLSAQYRGCSELPTIQYIRDITTSLSENVSRECDVTSFLPYSVTWFYLDEDWEEEIEENVISLVGKNIISFKPVRLSHAGKYKCVAKNAQGATVSNTFSLKIKDAFEYSLSLEIRNRTFEPSLNNRSSNMFYEMKKFVSTSVSKLVTLKTEKRSFYMIRFFRKAESDLVAHGVIRVAKLKNSTFLKTYNQILASMTNASVTSGFTGLETTKGSVNLSSPDICPAVEDKPVPGMVFHWPAIEVSGTAHTKCPFDKSLYLFRTCSKNSRNVAEWESYNPLPCSDALSIVASRSSTENFTPTSSIRVFTSVFILPTPTPTPIFRKSQKDKKLDELENLAKGTMTDKKAKNVSMRLAKLTAPNLREPMTEYGINIAAVILSNLKNNVAGDKKVRETCMDVINNLLSVDEKEMERSQKQHNSSRRLLGTIGEMGEKIALSQNKTFTVSRPKFALGSLNKDNLTYTGYQAQLSTIGGKVEFALRDRLPAKNDPITSVELPPSLMTESGITGKKMTIVFIGFANAMLFPTNNILVPKTNASVIAVEIRKHQIKGLKSPIVINFASNDDNRNAQCGFWDETRDPEMWSTKGCRKFKTSDSQVTCKCDHMTNFALLFGAQHSQSESHKTALMVLTYVGSGISLFGAGVTFVTYLIHPKLRETNPPKILLNLLSALIALYIIFLVGIDKTESRKGCRVVAILLQYSFLSVFSWSFVEGVTSFRGIVMPMSQEIRKFMHKAMIFGWGLPFLLTVLGASIWPTNYGSKTSCAVAGLPLYVTVIAPVAIILAINYGVLIGIVCSLSKSSKRYSHQAMSQRDRLRIIVAFVLLFGLTWVFGFLVTENDILAFQYVFCILSGLHGFFIFLFYFVRNENARKAWIDTLHFKRSILYSSSDTKKSELQSESAT